MRLVIIESPYAGNVDRNVAYARAAMLDCLVHHDEAPLASHLLYTQVLDDLVPEARALGIEAGLAWGMRAEVTVVYDDLGITPGMRQGIDRAIEHDRPVIYRMLPVALRHLVPW